MTELMLIFASVSQSLGLPYGLINSVCYVESNNNVHTVKYNDGGSDSFGLCEVKLETAKFLGFNGGPQDLMRPDINAYYAGKYLSYQLKRYHGDVYKAISAYNRGSYKEALGHTARNHRYTKKVISKWKEAPSEIF